MDKYKMVRDSVNNHKTTDLYYEKDVEVGLEIQEFRFTHQLVDYKLSYRPGMDDLVLEVKEHETKWKHVFRTYSMVQMMHCIYNL